RDPRAEEGEGVEGLAGRTVLPGADRDVEQGGVPEDVLEGVVHRDAARLAADHDGELALVGGAHVAVREPDVLTVTDHRGARLEIGRASCRGRVWGEWSAVEG